MLHASKLWSLDLHGPASDDAVLATAVASASLEIPELHGSALRGPGLAGLARLPKLRVLRLNLIEVDALSLQIQSLRTLSLRAHASNDREVAALLAKVPAELENLHLRGTAVSDAVLDALAPFHKLRYLDVVDTGVTTEGMQRFTAARPSLRFHPRPRKA